MVELQTFAKGRLVAIEFVVARIGRSKMHSLDPSSRLCRLTIASKHNQGVALVLTGHCSWPQYWTRFPLSTAVANTWGLKAFDRQSCHFMPGALAEEFSPLVLIVDGWMSLV